MVSGFQLKYQFQALRDNRCGEEGKMVPGSTERKAVVHVMVTGGAGTTRVPHTRQSDLGVR